MSSNSVRAAIVAVGLFAVLQFAEGANAACCGGASTAFVPTTSFYAGSHTAYYPTAANTGWYPGYWLNRIRTRLWGSPTTYVAAYPATTFTASYAPTYTASYAPSFSVSHAAPACSSCSTCQSCTVGYAPSACSACSACTVPSGVTQTSFVQQQPGCASCGTGVQTEVQQSFDSSSSSTRTPDEAVQTFDSNGTSSNSNTQPSVPEGTPIERQGQRPPVDTTPEPAQPGPVNESTDDAVDPEVAPYKVESSSGDSSTFFEAPKLHDPNDRTASRVLAPVKTALYKQPVSYQGVTAQPRSQQRITAEQARRDAIGWTSASN